MRFPGKFMRAVCAGAVGGLLLAASAASAQQAGPTKWHIEKINKADDAYFKAAIAIETAGESPSRLKALKRADDRYFDAVMAFEAAEREAVQIAQVEAADDAYFKAVMALEKSQRQQRQLAQLKARRQMIAQAEENDRITTAAIPGSGAVAENLAKIKKADDAYFDAVIALETSGENPDDLKRLKDADDAYFAAVIALEDAFAQQAAAKKAGKTVKVAAASPVKAPMAQPAYRSPAPVKTYRPKPKVAGATYRNAQAVQHAAPQQHGLGAPLGLVYNIVTFPVRVVVGGM